MLGVMRASTRTWLVVVIGGCVLAGGAYALTRPGKGQSPKTGGASAAAVPRAMPVVTAVTRAGDLPVSIRSEERRVGKGRTSGWAPGQRTTTPKSGQGTR